jgi:hypothetical protein
LLLAIFIGQLSTHARHRFWNLDLE